MDKWLLSGAGLLLIFECLFFVVDNDHFGAAHVQPDIQLKSVGKVIQSFQNVKRKNQNSLVWQASEPHDTLYENDSVLTLKNSSTKLQLEGDITLDIRQNTLVVLEPQNTDTQGNLLLKFSRGNLRGRSQGRKFRLGHGEWTFKAEPGSDVSLRSLSEGDVELEVTKGSVQLTHPESSSPQIIQDGHRLQIKESKLGQVETLNHELKWKSGEELKVYSRNFPAKAELHWTGDAESLHIQTGNGTSLKLSVAGQNSVETPLEAGNYFVYLKNKVGPSSTLALQVLPAPHFIYLSPLPRDRSKTLDPLEFFWMKSPAVSSYRLQLSNDRNFQDADIQNIESQSSGVPFRFKTEGEHFWRVQGVDPDGFVIPAPYVYPIYSLDNPLQAPRLITPEAKPRLPATQEESRVEKQKSLIEVLWLLLLPSAQAEEFSRKIIFNWYPVPDAEFYVIEISSKADFINPEIITQSKKPRFEWTNFSENIYYFRVAGEQKNGRRGLFSDPIEVNLTQIAEWTPGEIQPGVEYELVKPPPKPVIAEANPSEKNPPPQDSQKQDLKQQKVAENAVTEPPTSLPPSSAPTSSVKADREFTIDFYLGGSYLYSKSKGDDFEAEIENFTQSYTAAELNFPIKNHGSIKIQGSYTPLKWTPKIKNVYQSSYEENLSKLALLYRSQGSRWSLGVGYQSWGYLERTGLESVALKTQQNLGLAFKSESKINENWDTHHEGMLLFWGDTSVYQFNNHMAYMWANRKLSIGPRIDISYTTSKPGFTRLQYEAGLLLGLHW